MKFGAMIERGRIVESSPEGYSVESLDRQGISSPPIIAISDTEYTVGDMVYFFLFVDGTGRILCGM